jgi:hypothetical protein
VRADHAPTPRSNRSIWTGPQPRTPGDPFEWTWPRLARARTCASNPPTAPTPAVRWRCPCSSPRARSLPRPEAERAPTRPSRRRSDRRPARLSPSQNYRTRHSTGRKITRFHPIKFNSACSRRRPRLQTCRTRYAATGYARQLAEHAVLGSIADHRRLSQSPMQCRHCAHTSAPTWRGTTCPRTLCILLTLHTLSAPTLCPGPGRLWVRGAGWPPVGKRYRAH